MYILYIKLLFEYILIIKLLFIMFYLFYFFILYFKSFSVSEAAQTMRPHNG